MRGPGKAISVVFSEDGATLITKSDDGKVRGWEVATGKLLFEQDPGR
jgi:WD40 repeat protein